MIVNITGGSSTSMGMVREFPRGNLTGKSRWLQRVGLAVPRVILTGVILNLVPGFIENFSAIYKDYNALK